MRKLLNKLGILKSDEELSQLKKQNEYLRLMIEEMDRDNRSLMEELSFALGGDVLPSIQANYSGGISSHDEMLKQLEKGYNSIPDGATGVGVVMVVENGSRVAMEYHNKAQLKEIIDQIRAGKLQLLL